MVRNSTGRATGSEQPSDIDPTGLSIRDLTIGFSDREPIIDGLNLEVSPGQIIALVGVSGCGKSTLLRAIAGLQPCQSGTLQFTGARPARRTGDLAFVFQDATLLPWRTAYENVALPLELQQSAGDRRQNSDARDRRISAVLDSVEITPASRHLFPRQLSGGMRMRTSIARALITDPSLLLLDEPFAALDDMLRTKLNQLLLQLWQQRLRTILFVTHNIAEAVLLSHKVAVFGQQRIARLIDNALPWPRHIDQRTSLQFAQSYGAISQALTEVSN